MSRARTSGWDSSIRLVSSAETDRLNSTWVAGAIHSSWWSWWAVKARFSNLRCPAFSSSLSLHSPSSFSDRAKTLACCRKCHGKPPLLPSHCLYPLLLLSSGWCGFGSQWGGKGLWWISRMCRYLLLQNVSYICAMIVVALLLIAVRPGLFSLNRYKNGRPVCDLDVTLLLILSLLIWKHKSWISLNWSLSLFNHQQFEM